MGPSAVTLLRPVTGRRWKYVDIERSRLSALSMTTAGRWKQQNGLVISSTAGPGDGADRRKLCERAHETKQMHRAQKGPFGTAGSLADITRHIRPV
jgi:hypothetical protein